MTYFPKIKVFPTYWVPNSKEDNSNACDYENTSDPILQKPKCVLEAKVSYELRKWGQVCLISELDEFEIVNFDLGHPPCTIQEMKNTYG